MIKTRKVDWEKEYQAASLWEQTPHAYSILASEHVSKGKVLDLGSGEGYDALFFAERGYEVIAVDISQTAIEKMAKKAKEKELSIKGIVSDIKLYALATSYDIVVSYGAMQFLGSDFKEYIQNLKAKTNTNGVHAFYLFGNKGDFYDLAQKRFYFPSKKEIEELYADWNILKIETKNTKLLIKGDNGEDLYNLMIKILIQNKNAT